MSATTTSDATLDEIRATLAPLIADNAAFDGWTSAALAAAADSAGIDQDIATLAFTGGAVEMIDAWFAAIDRQMTETVPDVALSRMKVRDKITAQIEARLAAVADTRESLRRALSILAMPQNLLGAGKLGWRTVDLMWRRAGDTATDYNHYSKRAILGGVYAATITVFLDDESEDWADTRAFLARRIEGIMRFEKAKAGFTARTENLPSFSRFIGRLRYPVV
ncbi:COQ9 family protein [Sphingomonas sp. 28-63-12]|uniref:COQ9 family protein n=1 Tax=Sphingomonas sp. 28-63-12 TaxID=1970434 RepID=UPI000BD81D53|nr:MAG: RpsU-divergently transcribed [Sphingomonas sp. 28-63-12]